MTVPAPTWFSQVLYPNPSKISAFQTENLKGKTKTNILDYSRLLLLSFISLCSLYSYVPSVSVSDIENNYFIFLSTESI